jgi:hypothetical protein
MFLFEADAAVSFAYSDIYIPGFLDISATLNRVTGPGRRPGVRLHVMASIRKNFLPFLLQTCDH